MHLILVAIHFSTATLIAQIDPNTICVDDSGRRTQYTQRTYRKSCIVVLFVAQNLTVFEQTKAFPIAFGYGKVKSDERKIYISTLSLSIQKNL